MKKHLLALLSSLALTAAAFAHGDIEIGPNGGRILEFSKNESMHGEVTVKDGKFIIALLDKDKKPVALGEQTLTANGGPTGKAEKLAVEKADGKFVIPAVKSGEWLIVQFKENAKAKAVTARLQYDTNPCPKCKGPEWLCKCAAEKKGEGKEVTRPPVAGRWPARRCRRPGPRAGKERAFPAIPRIASTITSRPLSFPRSSMFTIIVSVFMSQGERS